MFAGSSDSLSKVGHREELVPVNCFSRLRRLSTTHADKLHDIPNFASLDLPEMLLGESRHSAIH